MHLREWSLQARRLRGSLGIVEKAGFPSRAVARWRPHRLPVLAEPLKFWQRLCTLSNSFPNSLLQNAFGLQVPFFFFSAICLLSLFFTGCCVPETRGRSLEQIEAFFHTRRMSFRP